MGSERVVATHAYFCDATDGRRWGVGRGGVLAGLVGTAAMAVSSTVVMTLNDRVAGTAPTADLAHYAVCAAATSPVYGWLGRRS